VEQYLSPLAIQQQIYFIRECRVMLDSDLARFYRIPTHRLNEQVSRNKSRFPMSFMFQLTKDEHKCLTSQIAISKKEYNYLEVQENISEEVENLSLSSQIAISKKEYKKSRGGRRHLPYAFTE